MFHKPVIVDRRRPGYTPRHPTNSPRSNSGDTPDTTIARTQTSTPAKYTDGTYYIAPDYTIRRHVSDGDDILVFAPRSYIPRNDDEKKRITISGEKIREYNQLKMLINMRDLVQKILDQQEAHTPDQQLDNNAEFPWSNDQKKLKTLYDSFFETYGAINEVEYRPIGTLDPNGDPIKVRTFKNINKFRKDPGAWKVLSLVEDFDENTNIASPGVIFEDQYISGWTATTEINTPLDALHYSENKTNSIDFDLMSETLNGMPADEIQASLSADQHIFLNPETKEWEFAQDYLSGFAYPKLDAARKAAEQDPRFTINVEALEAALPPIVPAENIDLTLGDSWIPPELIKEFAEDCLGLDNIKVGYVPQTHRWFISGHIKNSLLANYQYGTEYASSLHLLERALEQMEPIIWKRKDEENNEIDRALEKTLATEKQKSLQDAFASWVLNDETRKRQVEDIYNRTVNGLIIRENYDADHITFPGLALNFQPRDYQQKAAYRLGKENTLIFHDPGLGKTATLIMGIQRMLATGQINHACVVVPPNILHQFSKAWALLCPNADIFPVQDDKLFDPSDKPTPTERIAAIAKRAKQHKVTIMSKPAFDRIDVSPQTKLEIHIDKIRELEKERKKHRSHGPAHKHITKQIVKEKSKLKTFLNTKPTNTTKAFLDEDKDNDTIGADHLDDSDVDLLEANETEGTLGEHKYNDIYDREEREFAEINNLIAYNATSPKWAEHLDALNIDGAVYWEDFPFDHFGIDEAHSDRNLVVDSRHRELTLSGSARAACTDRKLRHMRKTKPGCHYTALTGTALTNRMSEIYTWERFMFPEMHTHTKTACYDAWITRHGHQSTELEISPDLGTWQLRTRYRGLKNGTALVPRFRYYTDNVINEGLDLDLPDIEGGEPQRILVPTNPQLQAHAAEMIERNFAIRMQEPLKEDDTILSIMHELHQMAIDPRMAGYDKVPEFESKIDRVAQEIAANYFSTQNKQFRSPKSGHFIPGTGVCQLVTCDEGIPKNDGSFSSHKAIKEKLVELGVPAKKIQFVHDYETQDKKAEFFRRCNTADIAVAIGTSAKIGIGANIQTKLYSLYMLTPSYLPADTIQTIARIVRDGNLNDEVKVGFLLQEGSSDIYRWQLNQRKSRSIHQIRTGSNFSDLDSYAEEPDEYTEMFEALKFTAANDNNLITYGQVRHEYERLQFAYEAYNLGQERQMHRLAQARKNINDEKDRISTYAARKDAMIPTALQGRTTGIRIDGKSYTKSADAGQALKSILRDTKALARESDEHVFEGSIGTINGFDMIASTEVSISEREIKDPESGDTKSNKSYSYNMTVTIKDPGGDIKIKLSPADLAERDFERAFLRAVEDDDTQNLHAQFNNAAEETENLMKSYANFAERFIDPYKNLDRKIDRSNDTIARLQAEVETLEDLIKTPFTDEDRLFELEEEVERLEALINKNPLDAENDTHDPNMPTHAQM